MPSLPYSFLHWPAYLCSSGIFLQDRAASIFSPFFEQRPAVLYPFPTMMLRSLSYISTDETERIDRAVNEAHTSESTLSYLGERVRNGNHNLVRHYLHPSNLSTLRPMQRVDDIVLNAYLSHLTSRDEYLSEQEWLSLRNIPNPPQLNRKNVVFNSFFLTQLLATRTSFNDVSQWQYMKGQMFSGTCKLCYGSHTAGDLYVMRSR
jgi:hypothetical protein